MFVSVSSADKDAEKTFDSLNRMIWFGQIDFEIVSIERLGSDHIHLVQKIQQEDIAISECCRGQNTSIYLYNQRSEDNHEDMLSSKPNQMWRYCKVTPWVKHFKIERLVVALPTV